MPSYRSTDFDVHRNWLAITHHLPIKDWYYDDVSGTTVHTLDYPPSFAYWEYILANNYLTQLLIKTELLDERCLELLPDTDNTPSQACVIFHRSTVILSDIVLWWGAWISSNSIVQVPSQHTYIGCLPASFVLIVLHPGLLWLDHIHFQYNGMLFGILLASLGYLMQGNLCSSNDRNFHTHHWKAAVLFAFLLTMKHLFLTLAPFYFVYLLRRYCLEIAEVNTNDSMIKKTNPQNISRPSLQPLRLVTVGMYTLTMLLVPFLPFLRQLPQVVMRLFPFGRGLVHDYWAANVWALHQFINKILSIMRKPTLPDIPASMCALLLLLSLIPGLYFGAWMAAARRDNTRLILAVVYSAMCSFQLGFHVHEKAILNAIIPFIILVATNKTVPTSLSIHQMITQRFLFFQMTALGLLGIFPLLFRVVELPVKLVTYTAYMALCYHILMGSACWNNNNMQMISYRIKLELLPLVVMILLIIFVLEFCPVKMFGKLEFLPLLVTSVGCAIGLVFCWIRLLLLLL